MLKALQEQFLKQQIQNVRTQIFKITHGIQILDKLGLERPEEWKVAA